jgi:IMP dehydrogenase
MYKKFQETLSFDDVMLVPQYSNILSRSEVDTRTVLSNNKKTFSLSIPIISANMDTVTESAMAIVMAKMGGLGIIHRFIEVEKQAAEVKKVKGMKLLVGAAVGVKDGERERIKALVEAGVDLIALDIAHGHSKYAIEKVKFIKKEFPSVFVVAGNVATAKGFKDLVDAGADAVKVGIGAGSICTTRVVTGFGIPQISAILDCAPVARKTRVSLISDGGIKSSGDIVKALAAGADAVMMGNVLAGTDEAPGKLITMNGKKFKSYRGMASLQANLERPDVKSSEDEIIEEGISAYVPYKGRAEDVIKKMIGGMRSGLSYAGAKNIAELKKNARFVKITPAGLRESNAHDVYLLNGDEKQQ